MAERKENFGSSDDLSVLKVISKLNQFESPTATGDEASKYSSKYKVDHKSRGIALIFNNKVFEKHLKFEDRDGTDEDRDAFKRVLLKLGFENENIRISNDASVRTMRSELNKIASKTDHTNNDCIIVAVFTHGCSGGIYGIDGPMAVEELWEPFRADKCISLATKPKLFFIQACRGNRRDPGVTVKSTDSRDGPKDFKIPCYADFLIHYSTIPGFYSWRDSRGSWFIQSLCAVLSLYGNNHDLLTLLTLVNQTVAIYYETNVPGVPELDKKKQVPCCSSMLTKKVYFKRNSQHNV